MLRVTKDIAPIMVIKYSFLGKGFYQLLQTSKLDQSNKKIEQEKLII